MPATDGPWIRAGGALVAAARMPGVAWAWSALGHRRRARRFAPAELAVDLAGKHCVVTGATSGLGLATARALAARGATVWLLCRDAARGEVARAEVAALGGDARLVVVDVGELAQVRRAAAAIDAPRIDALVHNAGALPHARAVTSDDLEVDFAVHLAGPHLLTRLLLPRLRAASGRVVFVSSGGMYSERLRIDDLRRHIGIVAQDPVIFSADARDNIRYGNPQASEAQVVEAAREAHADEFIRALPQGYETFLGERGVRLSGGQRQRIAIARALLKNPPLLLLDEATSALDSESELKVQAAIDNAAKNRTVLVIAHRLSTVRKADRIIVLDGGCIEAVGNHEALLKASPLYARLSALQFGTAQAAAALDQ